MSRRAGARWSTVPGRQSRVRRAKGAPPRRPRLHLFLTLSPAPWNNRKIPAHLVKIAIFDCSISHSNRAQFVIWSRQNVVTEHFNRFVRFKRFQNSLTLLNVLNMFKKFKKNLIVWIFWIFSKNRANDVISYFLICKRNFLCLCSTNCFKIWS